MKIKEASPQKSTAQTVQSRRSKCVSLYDETPLGKQYLVKQTKNKGNPGRELDF